MRGAHILRCIFGEILRGPGNFEHFRHFAVWDTPEWLLICQAVCEYFSDTMKPRIRFGLAQVSTFLVLRTIFHF